MSYHLHQVLAHSNCAYEFKKLIYNPHNLSFEKEAGNFAPLMLAVKETT